MHIFRREHAKAVLTLFVLVLISALVPAICLKVRFDAVQDLADEQAMLERLETGLHRGNEKSVPSDRFIAAPETAVLHAQTPGLANAEFEAYISRLAIAQRASLISSGQAVTHAEDTDSVRIQATLDIPYDGLQKLLYKLESGVPYVFIEGFVVQPQGLGTSRPQKLPSMNVTLNLRAMWRQVP